MKTSKIMVGITVGALLLSLSVKSASAQAALSETWIYGTVTDQGGNPVSGGSATVHCGPSTQVVSINSSGEYAAQFPQSSCNSGDTVSATASTGAGSGSNSATVQDTGLNDIVDLDIAVIDITVPEFGLLGGLMTGAVSVMGYLTLKAKNLV